MHELSVTENILDIALRHGRAANAQRITSIYLVIGDLSSIVDESVQFYWDFISEGTMAEAAQLYFRRIPAEMVCLDCEHTYQPDTTLACPACRGTRIEITAGEAFFVEAIDIKENHHDQANSNY